MVLLFLQQFCQIRMSTPRKPAGGPADATASIAGRAWQGTVASAVVIPTIQLILLRFANALQPYAGDTLTVDPITLLTTSVVILGVLPIISTLGSTLFAYLTAGWPGVILYYVISTGASMMLGAELTGAIIFITGVLLFLTVAVFKMRNNQKRRYPRRPM